MRSAYSKEVIRKHSILIKNSFYNYNDLIVSLITLIFHIFNHSIKCNLVLNVYNHPIVVNIYKL